jgi:hypothetical protein
MHYSNLQGQQQDMPKTIARGFGGRAQVKTPSWDTASRSRTAARSVKCADLSVSLTTYLPRHVHLARPHGARGDVWRDVAMRVSRSWNGLMLRSRVLSIQGCSPSGHGYFWLRRYATSRCRYGGIGSLAGVAKMDSRSRKSWSRAWTRIEPQLDLFWTLH